MGFDNECILNIQSLPGEYFCPYCRTLVYPNEALQTQCTHLYCKPCLAYVVATTRACPYDGYLVTEADSKPLIESNKTLAETIGKVGVHCLYHRSGCPWQGGLSDCITHCAECSFGNSPVICNRCGTQIMHRQVQEHGQTCPGVQSQAQQLEGQAQDQKVQGQAAVPNQSSTTSAPATSSVTTTTAAPAPGAAPAPAPAVAPASAPTSAPTSAPAITAPATGPGVAQGNTTSYPQAVAQTPTPEQWYQQQLQYQQYYQQYHGYDPYQQQYQQYAQYQQQAYAQYGQPQMQVAPQQVIQGQQSQPYMLAQTYPQPQPQPQPQSQPQVQLVPQQQPQAYPVTQPQPQPQPLSQPQLLAQTVPQPQQQAQVPPQQQHPLQSQMQPAMQPQPHVQYPLQAHQHHVPVQQSHQHAPPQTHPPQSQVTSQQLLPPQPQHPQPQPHQVPPQQLQAPSQHQQPIPPQQHPHGQMQHVQQQPYPQQHQPRPQSHPQPQLQPTPSQVQSHPMSQPQSYPQPQNQNHVAHAVTGHQSYPQPQPQQIPAGVLQQRPMQVPSQQQQQHLQHPPQPQNQFPPQQPTQMRPSHVHQAPMQVQQQPAAMPQGPHANLHPSQQQALRPGQQIPQHPAMQTHAQQQGLPQQQMHSQLHQGQQHFQGGFPPQQVHPQQALHSQGQAYRQQQIPVQPQLQQNAMSAMPSHQGQPVPARPMMPLQNSIHQPLAGQTIVNQHSPQVRANARPALSAELKPGSMLQNPLTQSDNYGHPGAESKNLVTAQIKRSDSVGLNTLNSGNSSKSLDREAVAADAKEKDIQEANNIGKDAIGSAMQGHGLHGPESREPGKNLENPEIELPKKEGATESVFEGAGNLHASEGTHGQTQTPVGETVENLSSRTEVMDSHSHHLPDDSGTVQSKVELNKGAKADLSRPVPLKSNQVVPSQGQISGATAHSMQNQPQHMLHQQINHDLPAHGTPSSQFTGHPNGLQDMPSAGPIHGQERYPVQPNLQGHPPRIPDPAILTQRPPAPERMMFPEHVPHSGPSQGRRLPDHSQQLPVHGQPLAPRPPAPNFSEMLPPQGQPSVMPDPFQTPGAKQSRGPWVPEVPHPHLPGTEPPAALARGQPPFGHAQHSFEERTMAHPLQNVNHMAPSHDGRPRSFADEHLDRQLMGRLPPPPRIPPFAPEGQMGIMPPSSVEAEGYATKRPGLEARLRENHPAGVEHAPFGQSSFDRSGAMVMNGGMHNAEFSQGLPKERFGPPPSERFKPFPEEGFNLQSDDRFRTSGLESGARVVNRREFEEDLKQFPRPAHLDDNVTPFGSTKSFGGVPYGSDGSHSLSLRPVGRPMPSGTHEDIGRRNDTTPFDHRMDSQPPFRSPHREYGISSSRYGSGTQPHFGDFNGRELHEFGGHSKPFNLPPDSVGSALHDGKISRPLSPGLPGYVRRSDHDGPGNLRMIGHKGPGILLDPPRKDMDGPEIHAGRFGHVEPLGHGYSSNLHGGEFSPRNRHGHLRFGEPFGHGSLRMNDPAGLGQFPSNLHTAEKSGGNMGGPFNPVEPGFGSVLPKSFDSGFRQGDMDSFSRIRMPGSMGWCRICKIDCETVEGLDLHSQRREHQKMAMNMVLSIKQENAKRQKLSVGNMPFEDPNRMRKPSFENRIK